MVPIGQRPLAVWNGVTPGYFRTFGVPLLRGRDFTWADDEKAPRVIVVSQSLASRFWPNENPLGKHLTFTRFQVPFEIVGVAGNTRNNGLQSDPGMVLFTSYAQWTFPAMALSLRTQRDPRQLAKIGPAQVLAVDRDQPVTTVRTVDELMGTALSQPRQTMYLIAGFAIVSLLLAVTGLYGAIAYSVAQRTVEIGIRQAIGAQPGDILRLVIFQGIRLAAVGIVAGSIAAAGITRLISTLLFRVNATDPATFAVIPVVFLAVALAASFVPAWRATRIDPLEALRR
jgi:putative ABC transport system permease protein